MSKINSIIPPRNFEAARNRVCEILTDELANQYALTQNESINASVWMERTNPFNHTELSAINVCLSNASYANKHAGSLDGVYAFNIDAFTMSKSNTSGPGDIASSVKCQQLLGLCQAILENPVFKTLGFVPGFVKRVYTTSLNMASPDKDDSLNSMWGRLIVNVELNESTPLINAPLISGYETSVKLELTDKGYLYKSS